MEIKFKIPNGDMRINIDEFFRDARKSQIRKMLKLYYASCPDLGEVAQLKKWAEEKAVYASSKVIETARDHLNERNRLSELEDQYRRMQSPCYAVYTEDEEKLKRAKKDVSSSKLRCRNLLNLYTDYQKSEKRFKSILEEFEKIFGGEIGEEVQGL